MKTTLPPGGISQPDYEELNYEELVERVDYDFGLSRRSFVKMLGAGLLIAVSLPALAQESGRRGGSAGARNLAARIHLGTDGTITVLAGKVEGGQGARAELTQAAAEELGVPASQVRMVLADTGLVPDDGGTYGSGTTPRTVPAVRRGAAAARNLLIEFACTQWKVERGAVEMRDGKIFHAASQRSLTYADLANSDDAAKLFEQSIPPDVELVAEKEWKVLGTPVFRPNARDIVTGVHQYPSDIARSGMLYGKVLRAPAFGAKLISIDLAPAKALKDVVVVQDDQFVGVAAPNSSLARDALDKISGTAKWTTTPQPSSQELFAYLKQNADGGVPPNPFAGEFAGQKSCARRIRCLTSSTRRWNHAPPSPNGKTAN